MRGDVEYLSVVGPADTQSTASQRLVSDVRAVAAPNGTTAFVGGSAAELVDGDNAIGSHLAVAIAIIAISTFILLFLFTGSLLLRIKALVLNLLSLTGVFGAMVWIFQDGHGSGFLGFTPGVVNTSMPVLLFCIAFGLSMDYEVFLLSRIKEFHDRGATNDEAVVGGLHQLALPRALAEVRRPRQTVGVQSSQRAGTQTGAAHRPGHPSAWRARHLSRDEMPNAAAKSGRELRAEHQSP